MVSYLRKNACLLVGVLIVMLCCIPFFILGEDSIITYHDQLDGEVLTYILNAKHMFDGEFRYAELMNGIPRGGMVSPAPAFILLYWVFKPFPAFLISLVLVKLTAFISMFLLTDYCVNDRAIAFVTSILFMLLPFYPVYGLSIPGQPLLWYAVLRLRSGEKRIWLNYIMIAVYGICSSFALGGFACVAGMFLLLLPLLLKKENIKSVILLAVGGGLLLSVYLGTNMDLIRQILPGNEEMQYTSHRSEMLTEAIPFWENVRQAFLNGTDYAQSGQKFFLPIILVITVVTVILHLRKRSGDEKVLKMGKNLLKIMLLLVGINLLCGVYCSPGIVELRNRSSGLFHEFNLDRIVWLTPVFWYLALALSIKILRMLIERIAGRATICKFFSTGIIICICLVTAFGSCLQNDLKCNVMKILRGGDYYMLTWRQFFAEDLFREVDRLIDRPKEEYRVVSLGIYPAAASYNGFYCLDAYSNNYDVEYKHEFRKVIEGELEKSEYLADWFDHWGNRCYIVLAETNNYFTFEKRWGTVSRDVDLDWEQLKSMGCEYIISASYIMDAESMGLLLLNEEPIESEDSWYQLFVYQL